jgi:hypothetical protein
VVNVIFNNGMLDFVNIEAAGGRDPAVRDRFREPGLRPGRLGARGISVEGTRRRA